MRWSLFFAPLRNTAAPEPRPRASRPRAPCACAPPEGTSTVSFHTAALGKWGFYFTFIQILLFLPIHPTCPSSPRRTRRKCRRAPTAARDRRESSHRLRLNSTFIHVIRHEIDLCDDSGWDISIKRLNSNLKFELQTGCARSWTRVSLTNQNKITRPINQSNPTMGKYVKGFKTFYSLWFKRTVINK